jgi:hypothetical protein
MRTQSTRQLSKLFCVILCMVFAAASGSAAIVWDLNPSHQNGPVGSSSRTYTVSGFSITAYGFDNHSGIGTAHELYYKSEPMNGGASETGLGLVNTAHNELSVGLHFMQFDFTAMLAAGMMNGQISVGSLQVGESFSIFGSNTLGTLGTQVGGVYGSSFDNQYVSIENFGQFLYYSVVAESGFVLPVSIRADLPPVPEMNAILPVAALLLLVFSTTVWRKRAAKLA